MSGEVPQQVGNDHPTSMPTSAYTTADGHMNVAATGTKMWQRVCEAIGRMDLFEHPDFRTAEARASNRQALNRELNAGFRTKKSAEWVEILNKGGVPCGPIYRMDEVFADVQVKHVEAATEVVHKRLGRLRLVNQPVKLSRTPARLAAASPERGEHNDEILLELGLDAREIQQLKDEGII
jgi:crotonobetainyl-CoA:carnitine CoA-transferase CaiB-like acyl-CoA transferase